MPVKAIILLYYGHVTHELVYPVTCRSTRHYRGSSGNSYQRTRSPTIARAFHDIVFGCASMWAINVSIRVATSSGKLRSTAKALVFFRFKSSVLCSPQSFETSLEIYRE